MDTKFRLKVEQGESIGISLPSPCSYRTALSKYCDITSPLKPEALKVLAHFTKLHAQKERLLELAKGETNYEKWLASYPTVLETLNNFSSAEIPLQAFFQIIPPLQPRFYSISSSFSTFPRDVNNSFHFFYHPSKN